MTGTEDLRLESILAGLLRYGTWLASSVIGAGLIMDGLSGMQLVAFGVALFISLPVLRVVTMLVVFVWHRDYRLVAVTAVVLATILTGVAIGLCMSGSQALAH